MTSFAKPASPPSAVAARLALVGDRSASVRAHMRIPALIEALAERHQLVLDAYWVSTEDAAAGGVDGFDAIWVTPGSPYRSEAGAVAAARTAREQRVPFLGTCGGFQHALLEFARNVCGLTNAAHGENQPGADDLMIVEMACSLIGHEAGVQVAGGTLAERVIGAEQTVERYHCSYCLNPAYVDVLRAHGMIFSGRDQAGEVRIAELPDHPFYLVTLFQPELGGDGVRPHPIIRALAAAAVETASRTRSQQET